MPQHHMGSGKTAHPHCGRGGARGPRARNRSTSTDACCSWLAPDRPYQRRECGEQARDCEDHRGIENEHGETFPNRKAAYVHILFRVGKRNPSHDRAAVSRFAAWLEPTPRDHSTGGRVRLGGITKAGDPAIRPTLIVGATALLRHVRKGRTKPSPWLAAMLERKPPKPVAVALANKFARIAWRLMISGGVYNRPPALTPG